MKKTFSSVQVADNLCLGDGEDDADEVIEAANVIHQDRTRADAEKLVTELIDGTTITSDDSSPSGSLYTDHARPVRPTRPKVCPIRYSDF